MGVGTGKFALPNSSSTDAPRTSASARAVSTEGDNRSPSIAVTAVREIPARDLYVRPQSPAVAVTEPELAPVELRAAA